MADSMNDMVIISVDDHVVEPPTIFDRHLPAKWLDRAPKNRRTEGGADVWEFEGQPTLNMALNAVAGRPREDLGLEPNSYDEIRKGCWDAAARLEDMSVNGILAGINFPTFPGFFLNLFQLTPDKPLGQALIQAYNDWHVDEFCAVDRGRFIPLGNLPLWDTALAVAELKRLIAKGVTAVTFPSLPLQELGLPSVHDRYWKPLLDAIVDADITLCIHIGSGGGSEITSIDSPVDAMLTKCGLNAMTVASEWLWSPWLRRYPTLRVMLSEGGIGWIPYIMERADLVLKNHSGWTHQNFDGHLPSEVFRQHFYSCFIEDRSGLRIREQIGIDSICYECDYPHADITWPQTPEQLWSDFSATGCTSQEIDKITHLNAMRALRFDPFNYRTRAQCTVAALRAQASHVDIAAPLTGGERYRDDRKAIVTGSDLMRVVPYRAKPTQQVANLGPLQE